MTKKKLIALILAVSFIFFCGASYLNFSEAKQYARKECEVMYYASIAGVRDVMASFNEGEEKDIEHLQESLRNRSVLFNSTFSENRTYACAVADKEGNIVFESESGVWFWNESDTEFISLEKYLTPEIKKEILNFKKKADGDILLIRKLELNLANGVYAPVSLEITDNHFDPDKDESLTVKLSELEVTHTFNEYLTCELYNLEDDKKYDEVKDKLKQELKTYDYSCNARLSFGDFTPNNTADVRVIETVGDYHFIGFIEYDLIKAALSSNFFYGQMITTAIVFVVLTAAALFVATVIFNKSVSAEKKVKEESLAEEEKQTPPVD